MQTTPWQLDLRDLMDAHYGLYPAWSYWTATGTGTDIGPALRDGLTALQAFRPGVAGGKISIPPGQWLLVTPPGETLLSGMYIEGSGSQSAVIIFRNNNDAAFYWSGRGYSGGGLSGLAITLEAGQGNTNSYAVLLSGTATYQPGQMTFADLYIDGIADSHWVHAFYANGNLRISPLGIRGVTAVNLQLFKSWATPLSLFSCVEWTILGGGCFVGDADMYLSNCANVYAMNFSANPLGSGNTGFWLNGTLH